MIDEMTPPEFTEASGCEKRWWGVRLTFDRLAIKLFGRFADQYWRTDWLERPMGALWFHQPRRRVLPPLLVFYTAILTLAAASFIYPEPETASGDPAAPPALHTTWHK